MLIRINPDCQELPYGTELDDDDTDVSEDEDSSDEDEFGSDSRVFLTDFCTRAKRGHDGTRRNAVCGLSTCAKVTMQVDQTEVVMDGESAELVMAIWINNRLTTTCSFCLMPVHKRFSPN